MPEPHVTDRQVTVFRADDNLIRPLKASVRSSRSSPDLTVVGTTGDGEKRAAQAAYHGKRLGPVSEWPR